MGSGSRLSVCPSRCASSLLLSSFAPFSSSYLSSPHLPFLLSLLCFIPPSQTQIYNLNRHNKKEVGSSREANQKTSCEVLRKRMQSNNSSHEEESFQVRRLEIADKSKGFIELLQQLTACDFVSDNEFEKRYQELSSYGDDHLICVIEDIRSGKIVATGSVFIEKKFIRNCGKVGHIEDVVVDSNARGLQLGKKIVGFLTDHASSMGCYKVILDCSSKNRVFYEKCGFKEKEIQMVKYFI